MAKITYASLKLKLENNIKKFNFKGSDIEVSQYLPVEDKYDLIMLTLQKSKENSVYNPIKLDIYFHLHLIYMCTNLTFTDKQREDELKIFDNLVSNGFLNEFLSNINEDEYQHLLTLLESTVTEMTKQNFSIAGVVNKLIDDLPKNAEAAKNIIEHFDKNQFQEVLRFAEAANGGRAI